MKYKNLEESILELKEIAKERMVKVRDLLQVFGGRGTLLLIIFLVIPFCLPIQIPGLSTPFGIAILFISLRMSMRHKIWLTKGILEHEIKTKHLDLISDWGLWFIKKLKRITHPRLKWIGNTDYLFRLHCIIIALLALVLALPLPIPLSNLFAAWAIFFICLGLVEDDGLFVIIGYILSILTFFLFSYIFIFLKSHLFNMLQI